MSANDINTMSLLDLFLMETVSQCTNLRLELAKWEEEGGLPDFNAMHRAIHSISGAARIVDLQAIVDLARTLEQGLPIAAAKPTAEIRAVFIAAIDQLQELTKSNPEQINQTIYDKKNIFANISKQLIGITTSPSLPSPVASPPPLANQGLFQLFREDAENHLSVLSDNLIQIERTPQSGVLLESSMRAVHSLKGAARIIELSDIVTLTHTMEDTFIAAEKGEILLAASDIDSLFAAADLIRDLVKQEEEGLPQWFNANSAALLSLTERLRKSATGPAAAPSVTPAEKCPPPPPMVTDDLTTEVASQERPRPNLHTADRLLRVSSQGMNRILALASEAMIESRWLPTITATINRVKRQQDESWYALEKLRAQLSGTEIPLALDNGLAEIVAKLKRSQDFLGRQLIELAEHNAHAIDISHRLHHEVISNRMQPLSEGLIGLPRLVRDLARQQGKSVRLEILGAETMIDRDILEKLESPFTHLITNAIDHGVETPEQRAALGKPVEARVTIAASHHAGTVVITVRDDGRGLDYETLRRKAVDKGLVSAKVAAELSEVELSGFLFLPNFSTKESVDKTSGRGVGLDIVTTAIHEIRGTIEIRSSVGQGISFELHLPLTLSTIRGLLLEINDEPYALPLINIDHAVRLPRHEIKEMGSRQYFISNGKRIGLVTAQQALELKEHELDEDTLSIVVLSNANNTYGLIVDRFQGIRDLVVQPLNPRLGKLRSISAAAIAEDGTPILILDINDLRQSMDQLISDDRLLRIEPQTSDSARTKNKRILVADDSITVREVERKILTEHGFTVEVAVDGLEAWNMFRQAQYDLVITDIDMPNLDGIQLLLHIKETSPYENTPVIILSYKDRDEDRTQGLEAGADYYLTKSSFHNLALIEAVEDLIGPPTSPPNQKASLLTASPWLQERLYPEDRP